MLVVAVILLLVVVGAVIAGLHAGPHGLTAAGVVGGLASVGVLAALFATAGSAITTLSIGLAAGTVAISVGALSVGVRSVSALRSRPAAVDPTRLWGAEGVATSELAPSGTVRVRGETWSAESVSGRIPAGSPVHVMEVNGLRLKVLSDAALVPGASGEDQPGASTPAEGGQQ